MRYREAPLPAHLRRSSLESLDAVRWQAATLGRALGGLLALPPKLDFSHISVMRVSVSERVAHLRGLLRSAVALSFDDAVRDADRMTVAVTLWALLELYKRGEAVLGAARAVRRDHGPARRRRGTERAGAVSELARIVEALLFLAHDPVTLAELAEVTGASEDAVGAALEELAAACAPGERGLLLREVAGGYTLASDPLAEPAARALLARPRLATLTPAQLETLAIVAYLRRSRGRRSRGSAASTPTRRSPRCWTAA